jgi:hypothetical protein
VLVVVMRVGALDGPQTVSREPSDTECGRERPQPAPETEEEGDPED